jgi:hypothetical protein
VKNISLKNIEFVVGDTAALELFVEAGCDVNQAANDGSTPAYIAALVLYCVLLVVEEFRR